MPSRISPFEIDKYYHIFNRGVAKQPTFGVDQDYRQAQLTMMFYQVTNPPVKLSRYKSLPKEEKERIMKNIVNDNKLVEIIAYVLMPNHFHFLLKQRVTNGITKFVNQFANSYTKYYNTKHTRVGHLFQGVFKSVQIESEEQLIHVSRYIHLNPYTSSLVSKDQLKSYPWSSYPDYLRNSSIFINISTVLERFNKYKYEEFVLNHADYARELEYIKHLTIDID